MQRSHEPDVYNYIVAPAPRPVSTISLGELFYWFFPGNYLPSDPEVHPIAAKCRNDPDYTIFYPDGTCASEREVGHTLYVLCRLIRPQNVIEVGSYHGASSICIATALRENGVGQLHCIDIDSQAIKFAQRNVEDASLSDQVMFVHGNSVSPEVVSALPKASLIFIDGDHTYDGVKNDFLIYQQKLTESGIMIFHDSIKHMEIRELLKEISEEQKYDIITIATSDGDGMSLLKRRVYTNEGVRG